MTITTETERPSIDYCGIEDEKLLTYLGEILVHNQFPRSADSIERELILGLLCYEYEDEGGSRSYHLTVRGHLVYDLLANNANYPVGGNRRWK